MNVPKQILYGFIVAAVFTQLAVALAPEASLVPLVLPAMKTGFAGLIGLSALAFYLEGELEETGKNLLMSGFLAAVLVPSFLAAGAFMHESQTSWTNGEVHYHADFEVFVENTTGGIERMNLINPGKFCEDTSHESSYMCRVNDRTGSTEYHEHNDQRIHLEGTFKRREDATLSAFFETFGGELTNTNMVYPMDDRTLRVDEEDGMTLKILVHRGVGAGRHWCAVGEEVPEEDLCRSFGEIADSPDMYVVSPYTQGPSLDDIFIVYDSRSIDQALQDVRDDNLYRGKGLVKSGEGYE